jgi:hypothetical protein
MLNFSIFSIPSYKKKYNESNAITKRIEEITSLLKKNNNYHERLKHDSIIKFNLDIDGKEEININELIEELRKFFKNPYEISYTQNKSKKNSYHIVIPKLYGSSTNLKIIASKFKKESKYEKNIDNGHLGVKGTGKWFRLPNQLKESVKGTEHEIIRGDIEDFVLHYIPENSILIEPEILTNPEKLIEPEKLITPEIIPTKEDRIYKEVMKKDYEYLISDEEIINFLNTLPKNYCDDYSPWLKITTILKSLNKSKLWDEYSRKSYKYDVIRNNEIWNELKESININWLVNELNKSEKKYNLIERMKKIDEEIIISFKNEKFNERYVSNYVDETILEKYNTVLIQSTTGTGKTSFTAKCFKKYLEKNKECKIISIISRRIMDNQHQESFKKEGIEMTSYLKDDNPVNKNFIICLNSLRLLDKLSEKEIENSIVYIDEINCLLNSLCLNNLISDLIDVNSILQNLIIRCKKLVMSDAVINQACLYLIEEREGEKIMYENEHKKYENVEAIKISDEKIFLETLKKDIKNDKPFFAGFDSCKKATDFYNECVGDIEDKERYLLCTSDTKMKVSSNSVKNCFLFYSPSITISFDYSVEKAQNVYLHIKGLSVDSHILYQMISRTRNIDKLYYYSESKQREERYKTLEDVKKYYKDVRTSSITIKNLCLSRDNKKREIEENTYFKIFCYYTYLNDAFNTNITGHFEKILRSNGFKLIKSEDKITKLSKEMNKTLREQTKNEKIKLLEEYLKTPYMESKYENIINNIEYLGIENEKIIEYKELILNETEMKKYNRLIKWCKKTNAINIELKDVVLKNFDFKNYDGSLIKIKHIKDIEDGFNIHILNENFNVMEEREIKFENEKYKELSYCFEFLKKKPKETETEMLKRKPKNILELKKLYLGMLKNAIGISFFKNKINNTRNIKHNCKIEEDILNYYLKLHKLKNKDKNNWNEKIYKWYCKKNNIHEAVEAYI